MANVRQESRRNLQLIKIITSNDEYLLCYGCRIMLNFLVGRGVNPLDLVKSFAKSVRLRKLASIQPRKSSWKFAKS